MAGVPKEVIYKDSSSDSDERNPKSQDDEDASSDINKAWSDPREGFHDSERYEGVLEGGGNVEEDHPGETKDPEGRLKAADSKSSDDSEGQVEVPILEVKSYASVTDPKSSSNSLETKAAVSPGLREKVRGSGYDNIGKFASSFTNFGRKKNSPTKGINEQSPKAEYRSSS